MRVFGWAAVLCIATSFAHAQTLPGSAAAPPVAASAPCCMVATGTLVVVELVDPLSSKSAKPEDKFNLRLAEPLVVNGVTLAPAGASGGGEVIDAAPPGLGGRPGKLVLAARYFVTGGVRVPLRAFKLAGGGKNYSTASLVTSELVGPFGLAVTGGNVDYPAGTRATAKIAADTILPPSNESPAPSAPQSSTAPLSAAPSSDKGPTP